MLPTSLLNISNLFKTLLVVMTMMALVSCDGDDDPAPPIDKTSPVVSFASLASNQAVWNIVPVEFNVTEDDGSVTLEVYADGNLIKTLSEAPFKFDWDSKTVGDGSHTIKVVATDAAGNKSEAQVTLIVKNVLLRIVVPDNHRIQTANETVRKFIVLNDENGDIITYAEVQNNATLELTAPSFNGDKFYVSEIRYQNAEYQEWTRSRTRVLVFTNVKRGDWGLVTEAYDPEEYSTANLAFINAELEKDYEFSTNYDNSGAYATSSTFSRSMSIFPSPSKLYVKKFDWENGHKYKLIESVVAGQNPVIDLGESWNALTTITREVPENLSSELYASAIGFFDSNPGERYYIGRPWLSGNNRMQMSIPGSEFSRFQYNFQWETENYYMSKGTTSFNTALVPITHTYNATRSENGLEVTTTGNFDWIQASFYGESNTSWEFFLPGNTTVNVVVPKMPDAVKALMDAPEFSAVKSSNYILQEVSFVDSYEDMSKLLTGTSVSDQVASGDYDFTFMEVYPEDESGRIRAKKLNRKEISKNKHNVWPIRR